MRTKNNCYEFRNKPYWFLRITGWVILGIIGAAALTILLGFVVMSLWNWLMPAIFGLGIITFWQALGILILGKIIFGSCGHGHRRSSYYNNRRWICPPFHKNDFSDEDYKHHEYFHKYMKHFHKYHEQECEKSSDDCAEKNKGEQKPENE